MNLMDGRCRKHARKGKKLRYWHLDSNTLVDENEMNHKICIGEGG
jgi:hypothetical protein